MTHPSIDPTHSGVALRSARPRATAPSLIACVLWALCGTVAHAADPVAPAASPVAPAASSAAPAADHVHRDRFSETVTEVYDGTWTATFDRSVSPTGSAKLVLADFAGTWMDVGPASHLKGSACAGKPMPVTVQFSQKEGFAFTVFGTSVSPQCPDLTVDVSHVDENTLEGTVKSAGSGEQKIRMVRSPKPKTRPAR